MKEPVTPWFKNSYQTWCYHREFWNKELFRGQTGKPWLYVKVWKKRTGNRWYYEAWLFGKTWKTSTRVEISGYTFSKAKSQRIVDAWLSKRKNLRLLSKENYQKLQVFM